MYVEQCVYGTVRSYRNGYVAWGQSFVRAPDMYSEILENVSMYIGLIGLGICLRVRFVVC